METKPRNVRVMDGKEKERKGWIRKGLSQMEWDT